MVVIVRSVIVIVVVIVVVVVCEESAHLVAVSAELLAGEAKRAEQLGNRRVCHGSSLKSEKKAWEKKTISASSLLCGSFFFPLNRLFIYQV